MHKQSTLMGGMVTTSPVYAKLMAVKHDEKDTVRTTPRVYPARSSTNKSHHSARSNDAITTN
jgi:hypothetical protein